MSVATLVQDVQYTVDGDGQLTAVVLSPTLWQRVLEALEDTEDRALVTALRPRLMQGPVAAGALRWQDVADQWQ
jgi:hypothetical protein